MWNPRLSAFCAILFVCKAITEFWSEVKIILISLVVFLLLFSSRAGSGIKKFNTSLNGLISQPCVKVLDSFEDLSSLFHLLLKIKVLYWHLWFHEEPLTFHSTKGSLRIVHLIFFLGNQKMALLWHCCENNFPFEPLFLSAELQYKRNMFFITNKHFRIP